MKKTFIASVCFEGAHGGGVYLTDELIAFRTNTRRLNFNMKYIVIHYGDISEIISCMTLLVFPSIIIKTTKGKEYKFIVFNRKSCIELIESKLNH